MREPLSSSRSYRAFQFRLKDVDTEVVNGQGRPVILTSLDTQTSVPLSLALVKTKC